MVEVRRKPIVLIVRDGWGQNPFAKWDHANRGDYFALGRDANWFDAIDSAREGLARIVEGGMGRWKQLLALEWMSINAGAWLWGML